MVNEGSIMNWLHLSEIDVMATYVYVNGFYCSIFSISMYFFGNFGGTGT